LLDSGRPLTIIRLKRSEDGAANVPSVLDSTQVRELWSDPFLRYSNLLDGLFHRGVVVCEAEGDARLYTAALDASLEGDHEPASDLLFAGTRSGGLGGVSRVPAVCRESCLCEA